MWLTELNRSVYRTGWHSSVWRTCRRRWRCFFQSCRIHTENHVLHPPLVCYPNETTMVMNCDALWANDAKRNFIYRQLRKWPSYSLFHKPTFYCLIAICQFIIPLPGKRICYVVQFVLMKTQVCTATIVFRRHRWFRLTKIKHGLSIMYSRKRCSTIGA